MKHLRSFAALQRFPTANGLTVGWLGRYTKGLMGEPRQWGQPPEPGQTVAATAALLASEPIFAHCTRQLIQLALPRFADACLVDLVASDGELVCFCASHVIREKDELLRARVNRAARRDDWRSLAAARGQPVRVAVVGAADLAEVARDAAELDQLRRLGLRSLLAIPLDLDERPIGVMTFVITEGERRFEDGDVAWACQLARSLESMATGVLASSEDRRLRAHADRAANRMARLQAIASALSSAPGTQEVAAVILRHGEEALGAGAGVLAELACCGSSLEVIRSFGVPFMTEGRKVPLHLELPLTRAVRERALVILATPDEVRARFPMFERVATVGGGGLLAAPLIVDGRLLGGFQLCFGEGRHPRDLDSDFVLTLAELAAQAIERSRLLDEACRAERRFHSLAETVQQQVWIETPDGKLEYLNQRALDYFGISCEEALSLDVTALHRRFAHPDEQPGDPAALAESRRAGKLIELQTRLRRADGVYRRHLTRITPMREVGELVTRWVGTATDVETMAQAEAALRERDAHLRFLTESAILGISFFGVDGTIKEANATALSILGFTREEVAAGQANWRAITPPEWRAISDRAVAEMLRTGSCAPHEKEYLRRDGSRVPVLVGAALISGAELRGVAFMVDISERKRIEREHASLQALEQTFRERLVGIVSHDLRNPLVAIDLWTQLLATGGSALTADDLRAIERISQSVKRMRRMIEQLLDLTRARQAGGIPIARQDVELRTICRGVIDELASAHPRRLCFEAEGDLVGEWDGDRLAQVVSNLAGNALQHGDGGPVLVRAVGGLDSVRLVVHNRGHVIPPDDVPLLFDPYRRGRMISLGRADGLGLGLYISQQIVSAHGGSIEVHSADAEGTTFTVELPRRAPASA
jgi:PAS domain S-box-containing protein